jgi:flagellar hook-associated protein 3 FlgL
MLSRSLLEDLQNATARLTRTQEQLSSGKKILVPSDDPSGTARALQLQSDLDSPRQYETNVGEAQGWQTATDNALSQISDLTLRARDLVVQGETDSAGPSARSAIADEIDQIIAGIKSAANAQYAGRYILGGTQTTTAPYNQSNDTYAGDQNGVKREIGPGVTVTVSTDGKSVVGDGRTGLIAALRQISTDLRSGATTALQTTDLQAIDTANDAIGSARAVVGGLGNRLQAASTRLGQVEQSTLQALSDTQDADMAQTMIDFATQQAAYQAALKAGALIVQPSLLDFLR